MFFIFFRMLITYKQTYMQIAKLLLAFVLLFSTFSSHAQFNHDRYHQANFDRVMRNNMSRYSSSMMFVGDPYKNRFNEIGVILGMSAPDCEVYYSYDDDKGNPVEKKVYGDPKKKFDFGLLIGTGIHLTKLSDKSSLGLNVGVTMNWTKIVLSNEQFKLKDINPFNEEIELLRSSIPISIDYKSGAEAVSDKYLKSMFAFGVGISPQLISYSFWGGYADPALSPFLKVEAGYYLGVAFKIRVLYFIGNQYWDEQLLKTNFTNTNGGRAYYKLSSAGEVRVALIVMPYSGTWDD